MAVSASFHDFDLVGDAFGVAVGLGVVEVVEDGLPPSFDGAPEVGELFEPGLLDMVDPEVEAVFGFGPIRRVVDVCEGFFEPPCQADFGVEFEELVESGLFGGGELVPASHEQPSAPPHAGVEAGVVLAGESAVPADNCDLTAVSDPDLLGSVVDGTDDMELVGDDPGVGENVFDGLTERPEHVDDHRFDVVPPGVGYSGQDPLRGSAVPSLDQLQDPPLFGSRQDRVINELGFERGLIDRQHPRSRSNVDPQSVGGPGVESVSHTPPRHRLC